MTAAKKIKLTVTLPDGTVDDRTTARTYTHAVYMRTDLVAVRADLAQPRKYDRENYAHHVKQLEVGVGNSYQYAPKGCKPFTVTVDQARVDTALERLGNCATVEEFIAQEIAARLAKHDAECNGATVSGYLLCGWCGRPDLAEKLRAKTAGERFTHDVVICAVN